MDDTITFYRMPLLLHLYQAKIRKTPGCWMGTPWGVLVPRSKWDDGTWRDDRYYFIRCHEVRHVCRSRNRPFFSRIWWTIHYNLSQKMRLDEEAAGFMSEIEAMRRTGDPNVEILARAFSKDLITDYGIKKSEDEITSYLINRANGG